MGVHLARSYGSASVPRKGSEVLVLPWSINCRIRFDALAATVLQEFKLVKSNERDTDMTVFLLRLASFTIAVSTFELEMCVSILLSIAKRTATYGRFPALVVIAAPI